MAATQSTQPATTDESQQYSIESNLKYLLALPWDACPWPAVRNRLLAIALAGADIYAYTHGPYGDGQMEWVIWHRQADPAVDARFMPRAWATRYGYAVDDSGKEAH